MAGAGIEKKAKRINKRRSRTAVASPSPSSSTGSSDEEDGEEVDPVPVVKKAKKEKFTKTDKKEKKEKKEKKSKKVEKLANDVAHEDEDVEMAEAVAADSISKPTAAAEVANDSPSETENAGQGEETPAFTSEKAIDAEQSFEDFYLRQLTREFANDLDKLRAAPDFHGVKSVDVLIAGLKQGVHCFSAEERRKVGLVAT